MGLFIFRFWPVLIPLLIYWLWYLNNRRKARKLGKDVPRFRDGPWYWAVLASLGTGLCIFVVLGLGMRESKGTYEPPHLENGKMIDGKIRP
ncbi:MAG: hypothetical protein AB7L92_00345 [Alphaproteobacteria bacterium]